ncbi:MAG: hypothetical protein KAT04_02350 [Methylococcales bacterium]|nr:hypothetical protein [Methylococcales bacterium]
MTRNPLLHFVSYGLHYVLINRVSKYPARTFGTNNNIVLMLSSQPASCFK